MRPLFPPGGRVRVALPVNDRPSIISRFRAIRRQERGFSMKMQEVRRIARQWGVDIRVGRTKQDIIRDIQIKEGYSPCFRAKDLCEEECLWKPDCLNQQAP